MVTVRLFARFKELAHQETLTLPHERPLSLKQFIEKLSSSLPEMVTLIREKRAMIAVNQVAAEEETMVRDGDEVALMPPFSGGSSTPATQPSSYGSEPWTRIQTQDFSVDGEIARIKAVSKRIGGIAVFLGSVRDFSGDQEVSRLIYEHYSGMAERKLDGIRLRAKEQFDIIEVTMIHRTGPIPVGENTVLIVVGAEHRAEAFRACRWCIDELKSTAPIWKKELTSEGEVWVESHPC
jgi:MoaE-MoaD fusion protein